ncbi:putative L-amino-acid oxidase YobN [Podospora aff. communis PSN243]|uniref:Amine oxidase n=1 Tax=Podospora aff. communis PSN243 TaxID=3040156 RepID=A0AAV9G9A1_9PEZI|nr:putative L-amino-acid oxidase YobN [Podospora aff. communis PSN243]
MASDEKSFARVSNHKRLNVGIVGGGIAGLYTALCLQREGHRVHIFEGTERIGGRVHTHYFTLGRDQYYEAGAMRIPDNKFQSIFFALVRYVNANRRLPREKHIDLIKYILSTNNNLVYVGGVRPQVTAAATTPATLNWPDIPDQYRDISAGDLLKTAVGRLIDDLNNADDFEKAFWYIVDKFDHFTFRYYCVNAVGWNNSLVDFVETMASQTNQFNLSVPELVMQSLDFGVTDWKTIEGGMSRLPEAMAHLVGHLVGLKNITFGARTCFDRVVLAIPPAALRMIVDRRRWGLQKEMAIRALHFEPLYKMGLRFKRRFWEQVTPRPSVGGQSTTDLPIRWIVYPSNGVPPTASPDTPGVLSWMTDATNWLPLSPLERRNVALNCLAEVYNNQRDQSGRLINVHDLYIESADHVWASSTATGDAMLLPGQFEEHFKVARQPEGPVYFAGEHLSFHHTWIAGAAYSALKVPFHFRPYESVFLSQLGHPSSATTPAIGSPPPYKYCPGSVLHSWPPHGFYKPGEGPASGHEGPRSRGSPEDESKDVQRLPCSLGMLDKNALGVVCSKMTSFNAVASWTMGQVELS